MKSVDGYSTWVEIDLGAIENNIKLLKSKSGVQLMAVVKANAYGHGMVPVAKAAVKSGADWLGVARMEEALELKKSIADKPILALGYTPAEIIPRAISEGISITVWNQEQIKLISAAAQGTGKSARLHIKVDTGMSRLGSQPEEITKLARLIQEDPALNAEGVFTHFARADEADTSTTDLQESLFREVVESLDQIGLRPPILHAANSAAILTRPSSYFNLVRAGIAMYGLHPSLECPLSKDFRPALAWKTVLSQVKILPPMRGVSYGHEYTTKSTERIGTIPLGYADGFRRVPGNIVLVGGKQAAVVGRVCMDQVAVQLDGIPDAKEGDEVVIIGRQGGASRSAEEVGELWETINYEVVCGVGSRVPRIYI